MHNAMADGTFVEAFGMLQDARYAAKAARKRKLATLNDIRLVEVTPENLPNLATVFKEWMT